MEYSKFDSNFDDNFELELIMLIYIIYTSLYLKQIKIYKIR